MPYVYKLAFKHMIRKRRRSYLSVISISLCAAIAFVSLSLFTTLLNLSGSPAGQNGYHYAFISDHFTTDHPYDFAVSWYEEGEIAYLHEESKAAFFTLTQGRMPEGKDEVIANRDQYSLNEQVGDAKIVGLYEGDVNLLFGTDLSYHQPNAEKHYYIWDNNVHDETSPNDVAHGAGIALNDITMNDEAVTADTIHHYLQDTKTLLAMFIIMIIIGAVMCLVSVYNVLIVNDQDRRKEIGLLKSIGMTARQVGKMLVCELGLLGLGGGVLGTAAGVLITAVIYASIHTSLNFTWSLKTILSPLNISIAMVLAVGLMVFSGMHLYRPYLKSLPITDIKGEPVQYDIPYRADRFSITSVSWRLFVIYNERIKKQTRNLRRSFMLVMLTITLFCGVWISNLLYQRNYMDAPADIMISPQNLRTGYASLFPELESDLYKLDLLEDVKPARIILGLSFLAPNDTFSEDYLKTYGGQSGDSYNSKHHQGLVMDDKQLEELAPYVVAGSLEDLDEDSVVLIYNQHGNTRLTEPVRTSQTGYEIKVDSIDRTNPVATQYVRVAAVVSLPKENMRFHYSDADQYFFSVGMNGDAFKKLKGGMLSYEIALNLENTINHRELNEQVHQLLAEHEVVRELVSTDYIQIQNDGRFAIFLISVLIYPLLAMLVVIGCLNINNVLKGNIQMKRTDFATMKSVGITNRQLREVMMYEYAETYLNAGVITFLISIPLYLLEHFFSVAATFRVGDNFAGMFIMSFALLSPAVIVTLAVLSFRGLKNISALDGMRDVE